MESAASIVDVEAADETSRQVQMSLAGSALPADAGHTAVLAALGRVGHSTWIGPTAETRTTGDPGHHAASRGLTPASWIVAFDSSRWEGGVCCRLMAAWVAMLPEALGSVELVKPG